MVSQSVMPLVLSSQTCELMVMLVRFAPDCASMLLCDSLGCMLDTDHRWISNKSVPLCHPPLYLSISQVRSYFHHISDTPPFIPVSPCLTLRPYVPCFTDIRFYTTMILLSLT